VHKSKPRQLGELAGFSLAAGTRNPRQLTLPAVAV